MDLAKALIARLDAAAAVTDVAGSRTYWLVRPQNSALPAVVLQVVGGERAQHLDGFEDMRTVRVQAACLAEKHSVSRTLAEAVTAALVPEAEVDGVLFWRASADEPRDLGNQTDTGFVHRAVVDLIIRYGTAA